MTYVFLFLFWFFGLMIGSFGLLQVITVIRFSIPYTKKLNAQGVLVDSYVILSSHKKTILFWLFVAGLLSFLVYTYSNGMNLWAYLVGIFVALLFGFRFTGLTESNIREYVGNYRQFININDNDIIGTLLLAEQIEEFSNS